jgi:hypothetical protein
MAPRLSLTKPKSARWALAATLALVWACGCGTASGPLHALPAGLSPGSGSLLTASGPAFGLTEDNADLLWSPDSASGPARFLAARRELTALHPTYLRLLVDWAALQPDRDRPPALEASVGGCARDIGPCGAYAGIRAELEAIATQQRATGGGFHVVIDIFGVPAWVALPPSGCELAGATSFSRPLRPVAIAGYRALIRALLVLATRAGVALEWWSPWNEPNNPLFISPQRSVCAAGSPPLSPADYAELVRAMAAELQVDGGVHHLLLGELDGTLTDSPHRTSISSFVAALPADVICLGSVWSIHDYAARDAFVPSVDPVEALELALRSRDSCGREAAIWVTEAGAGAPHPGRPRPSGAGDERAGCEALAAQLTRWDGDPRVQAVFQYTFREDPAFPVGLISADLSHLYPTYDLWLDWARLRAVGEPLLTPAAGCE